MPDKPPPPDTPQPEISAEPELPPVPAATTEAPAGETVKNENMDLHPQHLHKAPGRKAWHYFFEFVMLFLAITLGFFVENMREHYVENRREKEYAQSLYDDLKIDTFTIQRTYGEKIWIAAKFDSAINIIAANDISHYNEFMYYVSRYLCFNDAFTSQDVTYQQLRSSGNFRYLDDISLYKKIADYYNLYSRYQQLDPYGYIDDRDLSELEPKLFNLSEFFSIGWNETGNTFYDLKRPVGKMEPVANDEQSLKLLYIKFAVARDKVQSAATYLAWLKAMATELLQELRKEYSITI